MLRVSSALLNGIDMQILTMFYRSPTNSAWTLPGLVNSLACGFRSFEKGRIAPLRIERYIAI